MPCCGCVAYCRFLEQLVTRLSQELASRLAAEGPSAAHSTMQGATAAAAAAGAAGGPDVPLPPWIKDSRWGQGCLTMCLGWICVLSFMLLDMTICMCR